jgi:hypothetical protein
VSPPGDERGGGGLVDPGARRLPYVAEEATNLGPGLIEMLNDPAAAVDPALPVHRFLPAYLRHAKGAADVQRILDRAARRLLAARLDGDPVVPAPGGDNSPLDHGPDQVAPLAESEQVPVSGADGDRWRRGGE